MSANICACNLTTSGVHRKDCTQKPYTPSLDEARAEAKQVADSLDGVIARLGSDTYDHNHRARVIRAQSALRDLDRMIEAVRAEEQR